MAGDHHPACHEDQLREKHAAERQGWSWQVDAGPLARLMIHAATNTPMAKAAITTTARTGFGPPGPKALAAPSPGNTGFPVMNAVKTLPIAMN
jgi:hypothetical protein